MTSHTVGEDLGFEANFSHIATVVLEDLYMFMGRELEPLDEIPAGNILGTKSQSSLS